MKTDRVPNPALVACVLVASALATGAAPAADRARPGSAKAEAGPTISVNAPLPEAPEPAAGGGSTSPPARGVGLELNRGKIFENAQTVLSFALISLAPAAVLMFTAFVRIQIVLTLLRQALGSPQVPGNQVLTALALLLTALVMRPVADVVYTKAIRPYASGQATEAEAWDAGTRPIKSFMIEQIKKTGHENYVWELYDYATPPGPSRVDPVYEEEFPLHVVAPAYLLSELTTALVMGFYIYLPFLVIDLVVSAVLAAMGLFMLPPSLVALPLKLILFVLADGWLLVSSALLRSFAVG